MRNSKSKVLSDLRVINNILCDCYSDPNFCVERMADKLEISTSYLREIICLNFEICPQKLIESFRLQKSLDLIEKDLKEYEIVIQIGYSNTRSFRRAFKKRFRILPSNYRKIIEYSKHNAHKIKKDLINMLWAEA